MSRKKKKNNFQLRHEAVPSLAYPIYSIFIIQAYFCFKTSAYRQNYYILVVYKIHDSNVAGSFVSIAKEFPLFLLWFRNDRTSHFVSFSNNNNICSGIIMCHSRSYYYKQRIKSTNHCILHMFALCAFFLLLRAFTVCCCNVVNVCAVLNCTFCNFAKRKHVNCKFKMCFRLFGLRYFATKQIRYFCRLYTQFALAEWSEFGIQRLHMHLCKLYNFCIYYLFLFTG